MFFIDFYRRFRDKHGQKVSFLILLSFLPSFIIARFYALIAAPALFYKDIHIHHLNFGIGFLAISGLLGFYFSNSRWRKKIIVLYGIGLGLTFDEFGMWLHLEDHYWVRASYDAVIIISAILINAVFFGARWIRIFRRIFSGAVMIKDKSKKIKEKINLIFEGR